MILINFARIRQIENYAEMICAELKGLFQGKIK